MAKKTSDEKQLQEQYMQLQMIDSQIQEIQKELGSVEQKREEVISFKDSLKELKSIKKSNSFAELGMGIYAPAKIDSVNQLLVNVGANTYVYKTQTDVQKVIKKQLTEFEKISQQLTQNMQMLSIQAQIIQNNMQEALGIK